MVSTTSGRMQLYKPLIRGDAPQVIVRIAQAWRFANPGGGYGGMGNGGGGLGFGHGGGGAGGHPFGNNGGNGAANQGWGPGPDNQENVADNGDANSNGGSDGSFGVLAHGTPGSSIISSGCKVQISEDKMVAAVTLEGKTCQTVTICCIPKVFNWMLPAFEMPIMLAMEDMLGFTETNLDDGFQNPKKSSVIIEEIGTDQYMIDASTKDSNFEKPIIKKVHRKRDSTPKRRSARIAKIRDGSYMSSQARAQKVIKNKKFGDDFFYPGMQAVSKGTSAGTPLMELDDNGSFKGVFLTVQDMQALGKICGIAEDRLTPAELSAPLIEEADE